MKTRLLRTTRRGLIGLFIVIMCWGVPVSSKKSMRGRPLFGRI